MSRVAIVLPVYNDWQNAAQVVRALDAELIGKAPLVEPVVFVIDDGSTDLPSADDLSIFQESNAVLLRLEQNVGHQRAIIAGIQAALQGNPSQVVVMDADGEDEPAAVFSLIERARQSPESIVVAKRGARFESSGFRALYLGHKFLFRLLVGLSLDFGNFTLLPVSAARQISQMPAALTHFPAAILKSGQSINRLTVDRGKRRFGKSKMSFERLIAHSLASLSIFTEKIMVRILVFSLVATLLSALAGAAVLAIRLFSASVTPGWATMTLGLLVLFSVQFLSFAGLGTLITLNVSNLGGSHSSGRSRSFESDFDSIYPHAQGRRIERESGFRKRR